MDLSDRFMALGSPISSQTSPVRRGAPGQQPHAAPRSLLDDSHSNVDPQGVLNFSADLNWSGLDEPSWLDEMSPLRR